MFTFLLESFLLGLKNLRLHKLRSLLTALGIILGVLAVIVMVAIGEGAKKAAMEQMEQLGTNNIVVRSVTATKPTNVAVTSSLNPSQPGQSVTFTATVTAANGAFVTDGSVTFREGATVLAGPITLVNGQASFTTSTLALGSHTITASYTSTSGLFAPATGSIVQRHSVGRESPNGPFTSRANIVS